jgi:hypothetical protein
MPWARLDEGFPGHRKLRKISDSAFRLHVSAICWSAEYLTDGEITAEDLAVISEVRRPKQAAAELVRANLWRTEVDGASNEGRTSNEQSWWIHDYLDYNPSRAEVEAKREADAERKRKGREVKDARRPAGLPVDSKRTPYGIQVESTGSPDVPTRPDPTRPEGSKEPSKPQSRKTATPDIFPITDKMRSWAADSAPGVDLERETERFLSNHRSKGNRFIDWGQAWRTWMTTPYPKIMLEGGSAPAERRSETAKKFG